MPYVNGFSDKKFVKYEYVKALLEAGHHATSEGWFNSSGQFIAKESGNACVNLRLEVDKIPVTDYYITTQAGSLMLINEGETVLPVHGVYIWGQRQDSMSFTDAFKLVSGN